METGFMNKITGLVIALVVGGLLVGGLLAPTVAGIQNTVGDSTTITNPTPSHNYCDYYTEDVTIIFDSPAGSTTNATTTISIGDYQTNMSVEGITEVLFIGDTFYIQINSSGNNSMGIIRGVYNGTSMNGTMSLATQYTLEYIASTGAISLTALNHSTNTETTVFEVTSSVFFAIHENGKYSLTRETYQGGTYAYENMAIDPANIDNHTLGASASTTNITVDGTQIYVVWSLTKNGITAGTTTAGYTVTGTVEVAGTLELVDGTTDIYKGGTPTITLTAVKDDDPNATATVTFVPEASYILNKVSGHATAGPYYVMFGVLTLLAIVMLVVVAANGIRNKY